MRRMIESLRSEILDLRQRLRQSTTNDKPCMSCTLCFVSMYVYVSVCTALCMSICCALFSIFVSDT
jgi:hypothetical protein